jgi:hypothetical protein
VAEKEEELKISCTTILVNDENDTGENPEELPSI